PDKEIEGTVEEIGWRLTRIRTFDKRPLYVPNSVFNNIAVENPSRMQNRRIK
ncbi:MAG: mechanosensitive ion channel, partial [Ottowia sp.]|nr:mechanosensitive ion channel [Ottowia sp.]